MQLEFVTILDEICYLHQTDFLVIHVLVNSKPEICLTTN